MKIRICCPLWGHEHWDLPTFLERVRAAGYDGIETWLPGNLQDRQCLYRYVDKHGMHLISHQHEAEGATFKKFCASFVGNLKACAEAGPLLINSHTGRDYFTMGQHVTLVDIAAEFSYKTGIKVLHETHRGRMGYSPQMARALFRLRPDIQITADFSHWVCVTESMLENFKDVLAQAIKRTGHVHARIGFEEGPQVPDPRAPEWADKVEHFLSWWDRVVEERRSSGEDILSFTTEFGPEPYMPRIPWSNTPMVDQFEVNCYMKQLLSARYQPYI